MNSAIRRFFCLFLLFLSVFFSFRYIFPLFFPFFVGMLLALAAEPLVYFFCSKLRLSRSAAAGIGITMSLMLLALTFLLLCGFLVRQLRSLSGTLPELESTARSGINALSGWLLGLCENAPEGIRTLLTQNIRNFFSGSSTFLDRATDYLLNLASGILSRVPTSALGLGTTVISSFMISAKLPHLKGQLKALPLYRYVDPALTTVKKLRHALLGWLKAQLKRSCVTWAIVSVGLLVLRIPNALLWAILVSFVDAFPVLGTGVILVPWSLISFLQGSRFQAFGLLAVYIAVVLTRSVLEPKLVGRQLGLDPLITLICLYAGFQIWGIGGLILAPLLAAAASQISNLRESA